MLRTLELRQKEYEMKLELMTSQSLNAQVMQATQLMSPSNHLSFSQNFSSSQNFSRAENFSNTQKTLIPEIIRSESNTDEDELFRKTQSDLKKSSVKSRINIGSILVLI